MSDALLDVVDALFARRRRNANESSATSDSEEEDDDDDNINDGDDCDDDVMRWRAALVGVVDRGDVVDATQCDDADDAAADSASDAAAWLRGAQPAQRERRPRAAAE